ncbi:hypothetical protein [Thiorhodovibrio winogradskyi]|uniref:hypothetical protein n=1 Tax=Thiorhodovibrio winogradskyi TaxID=77007 RepID=UPI002E2B27D2|nr:hypothetical protein [Thiorhodovibrio winogradskyi]
MELLGLKNGAETIQSLDTDISGLALQARQFVELIRDRTGIFAPLNHCLVNGFFKLPRRLHTRMKLGWINLPNFSVQTIHLFRPDSKPIRGVDDNPHRVG